MSQDPLIVKCLQAWMTTSKHYNSRGIGKLLGDHFPTKSLNWTPPLSWDGTNTPGRRTTCWGLAPTVCMLQDALLPLLFLPALFCFIKSIFVVPLPYESHLWTSSKFFLSLNSRVLDKSESSNWGVEWRIPSPIRYTSYPKFFPWDTTTLRLALWILLAMPDFQPTELRYPK
jgi:hypothetical protein